MPPLSADERAALKADIASRGVQVPVEYDEMGNILDGHHRTELCHELGITHWPRLVRHGLSEEEKRRHARRLNLDRRHLNTDQKRSLIEAELREAPDVSDRAIAWGLGVDHKTVGAARDRLESDGEIPRLDRREGRDGKVRRIVQFVPSTPEEEAGLSISAKALRARQQQAKGQRREEREADLADRIAALPTQKFGVILADPEWRFEPWSRETGLDRSADNHYPTSCLEVIKSRDVASIAAPDCILFLWATVPMLPHALSVMEAWGFDYRSHCVWIKDRIGTGYWFRNKHELLLVGVRGNIPAPAMGTQWDSAQGPTMVQSHSQKPDDFLMMIEAYFPTLPKIELNRRGEARKGWEAWGNEVVASDLPPHDPDTGEILPEPTRMTEDELLAGLAPLLPPEPDLPDITDYLKRGHPDCPAGAKP